MTEPLTPEQPEQEESVRATLELLADAIKQPANVPITCPICKQPVQRREQVRRCVYMVPCGCHYQGSLK